jgi:hypothetical protein
MTTTNTDPLERVEPESAAGFLKRIEFVTGPGANLGSLLLGIGLVTCVFVALFQLTIPDPVSQLLTAGVLFVTVLSAIFALVLDSLGHFEATVDDLDAASTRDSTGMSARTAQPWVPANKPVTPLPPILNFDDELQAYSDMYDGDLPKQFDPFIQDYRRLKINTGNRRTIESDLRADLNPIGALFQVGTEGYELYERIGERLFRYTDADAEHVSLSRVAFYDATGEAVEVGAVRNQLGRVELTVGNEGEAVDVDVVVQFYDTSATASSSRTCRVGTVRPGASRTADTDVFVPTETVRAGTTIRVSPPGLRSGPWGRAPARGRLRAGDHPRSVQGPVRN